MTNIIYLHQTLTSKAIMLIVRDMNVRALQLLVLVSENSRAGSRTSSVLEVAG